MFLPSVQGRLNRRRTLDSFRLSGLAAAVLGGSWLDISTGISRKKIDYIHVTGLITHLYLLPGR